MAVILDFGPKQNIPGFLRGTRRSKRSIEVKSIVQPYQPEIGNAIEVLDPTMKSLRIQHVQYKIFQETAKLGNFHILPFYVEGICGNFC